MEIAVRILIGMLCIPRVQQQLIAAVALTVNRCVVQWISSCVIVTTIESRWMHAIKVPVRSVKNVSAAEIMGVID